MYIVILIMLGGITCGYLLRRKPWPMVQRAVTPLIGCLLFLLGNEVGNNKTLMQALPTLGIESALTALAGVLGSAVCAWLLWSLHVRMLNKRER